MTLVSTQPAPAREYPTAPPPSSTPQTVRKFFTAVLLANDSTLSPRRAEEIAGTLPVNGESLYMLDRQTFEKAFRHHGTIMHHILQGGKYGVLANWSRRFFWRWPRPPGGTDVAESPDPETEESYTSVVGSSHSSCSYVDDAVPTGSSVQNHSGPRDSRSEAIAQEGDRLGCLGEVATEQARNGIRNRRQFNRDID